MPSKPLDMKLVNAALEMWCYGWPDSYIAQRIGRHTGTIKKWSIEFQFPKRQRIGRMLWIRCDNCRKIFRGPDAHRIPHLCIECDPPILERVA